MRMYICSTLMRDAQQPHHVISSIAFERFKELHLFPTLLLAITIEKRCARVALSWRASALESIVERYDTSQQNETTKLQTVRRIVFLNSHRSMALEQKKKKETILSWCIQGKQHESRGYCFFGATPLIFKHRKGHFLR